MIRLKSGLAPLAGIGLAVFGAVNAEAQRVITPGQVLESVRPRPESVAPAPTTEPVVIAEQPVRSKLDPNAPRFAVNSFNFTGNTAVNAAQLQTLVRDYAGKQYNLFELQAVLDTITAYYQQLGYVVARAVIPAQKMEDGALTLEVIEGRVDRTVFSGNRRYGNDLLARWGAPLVDREVQLAPLEERLLLLNDLPGVTARAVLRPGERYGTTTTEIAVEEDPIEGHVDFNNYGREEVGEHRVDAAIQFNNPLGIGDQLGLFTSQSEADLLHLYGINYSLPIGVYGTRLAASYTYVDYDVGGDLRELDLSGESHLASLGLSHPLLRSRTENLYGTITLRSFSGEQFISGDSLSDSDVTLLELGLAWSKAHASGNISAAGLRVSSNFHDSDKGTADNAHLFKIDGEFNHLIRLGEQWELKLETGAMWSPDALVDAERFGLGGPTSVRGYPSAWALGDRGLFGSVEGRYRFRVVDFPAVFSLFVDGGYVGRKYPAAGTEKSANLSSFGATLQFAPTPWFTTELIAAVPTGDMKSADGHEGGRVWFNLSVSF